VISSELASTSVFIGGKSMGGRIATQVAAGDRLLPISGLVLLGYPLHPPGRPDERRDRHLAAVGRPMFFVQGDRDAFGTPEELRPVLARLSPPPTLHVVDRGDHSFKVPRAGAGEQDSIYAGIQSAIAGWIKRTRVRPGDAG
jgi:predicted alpha/beta-hydrolase family hydrolase